MKYQALTCTGQGTPSGPSTRLLGGFESGTAASGRSFPGHSQDTSACRGTGCPGPCKAAARGSLCLAAELWPTLPLLEVSLRLFPTCSRQGSHQDSVLPSCTGS